MPKTFPGVDAVGLTLRDRCTTWKSTFHRLAFKGQGELWGFKEMGHCPTTFESDWAASTRL